MVLSHTSRFWCVDKDAFVKSPVPSKTLPGHSHGRILIPDPAETNYLCIFTRQRTTVVPEGDIPQYHMLGMVSRPKNSTQATAPPVNRSPGHLPVWVLREDTRQRLPLLLASSQRATPPTCLDLLRRGLKGTDLEKDLSLSAPTFLDMVKPIIF